MPTTARHGDTNVTGAGAFWSTTMTTGGGPTRLKPVSRATMLDVLPSTGSVSDMRMLTVRLTPDVTMALATTKEKV